jgi:uncharacterized protein
MAGLPFNHIGFNAHLSQERLMGVLCINCGALFVPPRELCTACFRTEMKWQALSGAGRLVGFTAIHVGLPALAQEGYDMEHPYCSGVVKLSEGPSISAQIIGVDGAHPETVHVGMPLQVAFISRGRDAERRIYLAFAPVTDPQ